MLVTVYLNKFTFSGSTKTYANQFLNRFTLLSGNTFFLEQKVSTFTCEAISFLIVFSAAFQNLNTFSIVILASRGTFLAFCQVQMIYN
jgi:hypothetical protein